MSLCMSFLIALGIVGAILGIIWAIFAWDDVQQRIKRLEMKRRK